MSKDTIMNKRQNSQQSLMIYTNRFDSKATYSEILGDLQQMTDSDIKFIFSKKPRSSPFSPSEPPKRQKLKKGAKISNFASKIPEDASAILGFASFLTESEAQCKAISFGKLPPNPRRSSSRLPLSRKVSQRTVPPPSQQNGKCKSRVTPKRLAVSNSEKFPRSASHLAMAYFIKEFEQTA
ncbi:unnamed protein product [Blepharisma stoltei]|uniref:Uncharacterized protein n=1 Tax=Blepharisma stoltei TaxID=1481888 RepID=A0AAU9K412_9CILI|nr:unnamed protein product [Blepharisma stoltei]